MLHDASESPRLYVQPRNGFEASYSCGEDQSADTVLRVETDGAEHLGDINVPGKRFGYSFAGSAGYTYQIATQLRGLDDSVMVIFADDMETRIAENDDNGNSDGIISAG